MTSKIRNMALLVLMGTACATGGGAAGGKSVDDRYHQADYRPPQPSNFSEDAERGRIKQASETYQRGTIAQSSGNLDQARAEWASAADQYLEFVQRFPSSEWRITLRYLAAELYQRAQQPAKAAAAAEGILTDTYAKPHSKAMASHLAAIAWQNQAVIQSKAGQLDAIKLPTAEQRKGEPLNPRPPPGAWKRFVDATDAYVKVAGADPDLQKPVEERRYSMGPGQLGLIAAEVEYAFDNMEDARARFEKLIQQYPNDPNVMESAVPLYLQTFLVTNDQAGYQAALARVKGVLQAQGQAATDTKAKEAYAKIGEQLARYEQGSGFSDAARLLQEGKPGEAAAKFEKFAAEYKDNPDAANALFNAGVAYDKANQAEKAAHVRDLLITNYPDSKVVPQAMLMLATHYSKKDDHARASKLYSDYLAKYPDAQYKCVALQNVGYELDVQNKRAEAAERYLAFGTEAKCAKDTPNDAAKALFRAGQLFEKAKQAAKAKEAYRAAASVQGVTDVVAQSQMAQAKQKAGAKK